jgi:DNA-directed RNA polymerase beta' subunit
MSKYSNLNSVKCSKIVGIQFSILSPEEILKGSVAEITNRDTYINNKPVIGGLFDPRMGVLEPGLICPTDGLDYMTTPGYFGHIVLARPVFYIQYINTILKCLRCVCFKCSKLLINKEKYNQAMKLQGENRWKYVFALASKIKRCGEDTEDGCGCLQPTKIRKEGLASIFAEWKNTEDGGENIVVPLTPEIVLKIFKRISDEDVTFMGFSPIWSRPDWMICQIMSVPPPSVRPSVKHDAQQRSEDDLSHILVNIIKTNKTLQEKIQNNAAANVIDDWTTVLQYYVATQVDNKMPGVASVAQRSGRPLKSIKDRLSGKGGRMRGNLMAKRVDFSARSVITADPNISISELGIPMKIAKNITKPVVVNKINKAFLTKLVKNGPDIHPGAKILEKKNGESITLRYIKNSIVLEEGDIVHRHMMDGDAILFNRQPTLHRMSMMCHIAKIMTRGDTFRMNVADTKPYNADFDGDEMNLHMPQDPESEAELRYLAAVPYQIISPANNSSIIGIYQDSMLGCYQFTREDIKFTPRDAMNMLMMFNGVNENEFAKNLAKNNANNLGNVLTSFDLLSQIMPPLSLRYKTKAFNDEKDDYKTSNTVLEIKNGEYIRGQMDKGVLGAGTKGLLHRTCNDFGNMASAKFIDDLQNIITEYMKSSSFSVGISDLVSDDKINNEIINIITKKKNDVKDLIDQTQIGVFENNTGKTNEQEFETKVNNILNQATSEAGKIGLRSLGKDNRFVTMVNAGSKGSDLNISFMISCLGQQNVDGKRIPYGFENRTLPHYSKFDDSPSARGFVESSYINGLSPQELFFHAMGGRVGLIDTAVKSVTWDTQIIIIENKMANYTEIGKWIDHKLDDRENKSKVQHFTERRMELLNINDGDVYIPTTDENGIVTWGAVTAVTRHDPGTALYEIKTSGGRSVTVTESKSLLIWNEEESKFIQTNTPEIKIGDYLPVTLQLCNPPVIVDSIDIPKYTCNNVNSESTFYDKFDLNEENGILIGLFIANGDVHNDTINIRQNCEDINNFVKKWFDKYSIICTENTNICGISAYSPILTRFITELLGDEEDNKHVPVASFTASEPFIIGLLNGYFTGDAIIGRNNIKSSSSSRRLIEDINMLCSRIGVFGKVFETVNNKSSFSLSISSNWGKIFTDKVNLISNKKNQQVKDIIWNDVDTNFKQHNDVVLDAITEINIIGVENNPKMYDLTIPSTLNFGLANGLQVADTSTTGYIQRRLIKGLEDLMVNYDMTIRTNKNKIVQFKYGDDNFDTIKVENQIIPIVSMSIQEIYSHFNIPEENEKFKLLSNILLKSTLTRFKKQQPQLVAICSKYTDMMIKVRSEIIKNVFKNKDDSVVNCPVAFSYIIGNVQGQCNINNSSLVDITIVEAFEMIEYAYAKLEQIYYAPPTMLFKTLYYYYLSPKDLLIVKRFNKNALTVLLDTIILDYKRAIVAPGEMVGMIAGQSIGEVSTQMSVPYNTQHKILIKNKETGICELKTIVVGEFIDDIIHNNKQLTFNTGHPDSVETILETDNNEYYIQSVGEKENIQWSKISHVSKHPVNGQLMKIQTKSGRIVETTPSHSHLIRENHKVVPIVGKDMKEGMRIPVCKKAKNLFTNETITLKNNIILKLDKQFGWFIGAYLAAGNLNYNEISITNVSDVYVKKIQQMASVFGKLCRDEQKQGEFCLSNTVKFNFPELAYLLLNTCGTSCYVKRVPDFAFTASDEFKSGLFQGYFDGNGQFQCDKNRHQIRCCGRSEQLIKDLALILNYFDIFGYINCENKNNNKLYHLNISSKYANIYQEKIGSTINADKLQNIVSYISRTDVKLLREQIDKINGLGEIIAHCGKTLQLPEQSKIYGYWKNKESIGRRTLEMYYEIFKNHQDSNKIHNELILIEQAIQSHVVWDEIIHIEYYTPEQNNYVYDFTVPGDQTFMTDYGVLVHNTLNTFHFAGVASKSNVTRGVPRIEEILSLSSEPKNPSLTIRLKEEDETQKDKARSIMYMLEHTKLQSIVKSIEICFDPDDLNTLIDDDKETISQFKEFENMVSECAEVNLSNDEDTKSKWIIRMEMDAEIMLDKNITMDDVNFTLKNSYENQINCIYSDYNSDKLIFRIRMNEVIKSGTSRGGQKKTKVNPLDQSDQIYILKNLQDQILQNIVLRGVKNINKVILRKVKNNVFENNGVFEKKDIWVLDTVGTNMLDVLALDYIDASKTLSNDIVEVFKTLGIEAARQSIYNELAEVIEFDGTYINYHNFSVLVDRMTFTSKMISIFRHGINNDNIGPIAKASFEETPEMFLKAARHAELDTLRGVSANVMCGQEGYYGTSSFQVVLDIEEMQKLENISQYKPVDEIDEIDKFFGDVENPDDPCGINKIAIQNNVINIKSSYVSNDNDYNPGF